MKLIAFIKPTPDFFKGQAGTHNGYVAVPPEHPYYDKDYEEISVEVHEGLTYSSSSISSPVEFIDGSTELPDNYWILGFDTCHFGDNPTYWNKERVIEETLKLKEQLEQL